MSEENTTNPEGESQEFEQGIIPLNLENEMQNFHIVRRDLIATVASGYWR